VFQGGIQVAQRELVQTSTLVVQARPPPAIVRLLELGFAASDDLLAQSSAVEQVETRGCWALQHARIGVRMNRGGALDAWRARHLGQQRRGSWDYRLSAGLR
jgi:hypothetical protein